MNSPQDVKNWYLNDSFNSKVSPGNQTNYRLACVISPSTATLLSFYQQPNSIYLGSNLDVLVSSTETKYKLLYYSYVYDASQKEWDSQLLQALIPAHHPSNPFLEN